MPTSTWPGQLINYLYPSDTDFAGYPANLKAGYRISGAGRIPDIRPEFQLDIQTSFEI
jgi:hypothetical protein